VACIRKKKNAYRFWLKNLKEGDHLEGLMYGRLQDIKKRILKKLEGVDWIDLAQDRDALSMVTKLKLP